MKKIMMIFIMLSVFFSYINATDFPVTERSTIEKEVKFPNTTDHRCFVLDNVFGSIKISGYNGNTLIMSTEETIEAKTKEILNTAKSETELKIATEDNCIKMIVDGPFRTGTGSIHWDCNKTGYKVQFDFEIKVPFKTQLKVKTINNGNISIGDIEGNSSVKNVNGKIVIHNLNGNFTVQTVNGEINMDEIIGSGEAETINGKVSVVFTQNPSSTCSFKTVNGNLELSFISGLSSDFFVKVFRGEILSDFPVTYLPSQPGKGERKNKKYIYHSSSTQGVRIGNGGPEIKLDTLNGNVLISKK